MTHLYQLCYNARRRLWPLAAPGAPGSPASLNRFALYTARRDHLCLRGLWPRVAGRDATPLSPRTRRNRVHDERLLTMDKRNPAGAGRPVTIMGVEYPSCAAAGRALGMHGQHIRRASALGIEHLIGTCKQVPVTIDNITYPSRAEAARALGISYGKLR